MFTLLFQAKEMKAERHDAGHGSGRSRDGKAPVAAAAAAGSHLDRLPQSAAGIVRSIGGASTPLRQRLMELGITIGSEIRVIRKAPFGGPIEISVRGYRLSLRRTEAHIVMVDRHEK